MLSKRFPFGIYYEVEGEVVYVYATQMISWSFGWKVAQLRLELEDSSATLSSFTAPVSYDRPHPCSRLLFRKNAATIEGK